MRYAQITERFRELLAARAACSREWRISPTVIMCAEFDIYAAARSSVSSFGLSSDVRREGDPHVRVSFFDPESTRVEISGLSKEGQKLVAYYRGEIERWVAGQSEDLPHSTSHTLADRFRR